MKNLPENPPLFQLRKITHIGTLDAADKGAQGDSLEGAGLSVSRHPEAWESIARLGGLSWWESDAKDLQILNGHSFVKRYAEALQNWGLEQGLVEPAMAYIIGWTDGETDTRCESWMDTREEAEGELECYEDEEPDIREHPTVAPTAKLVAFMAHRASRAGRVSPSILDDLATAWAQDKGLDGVWWADTLDPESLSAPRGVVFPEKVHKLSWTKTREPQQIRTGRRFG